MNSMWICAPRIESGVRCAVMCGVCGHVCGARYLGKGQDVHDLDGQRGVRDGGQGLALFRREARVWTEAPARSADTTRSALATHARTHARTHTSSTEGEEVDGTIFLEEFEFAEELCFRECDHLFRGAPSPTLRPRA